MDSTGFSENEQAQHLPGVLHGKRLTLENLNERLLAVEHAVFTPKITATTDTVNVVEHVATREEFEARIRELEAEVEYWKSEFEETERISAEYWGQLEELRSNIRGLGA